VSNPGRRLASRIAVVGSLVGAIVVGGLLAVKRHNPAPRATSRAAARARTIAAPTSASAPDSGHARTSGHAPVAPVATVIPPEDAGPSERRWPPPLLNPTANLRMSWDLALGRPQAREVLFTFDDGPNPGTTDRLLNILDRAHIKAVFFVCGWRLEGDEPLKNRARAILRDTFARGHVIGNHTVHHRNMATLTPQQVAYEIDHNAQLIEEVIGQRPHLFRPPYGSFSEDVRRHVVSRGDEMMLWSVDSHDWQMVGNAQAVAANVIRILGNMAGGTVLMHDTHPWSVSAAQMIFRWLETENRDRAQRGRAVYRVMNPAEFMEGSRERIPLIEAARAQDPRQARRARREAAQDAATGSSTAPNTKPAPSGTRDR
jgi:peptidoglycan/xylan/chitin deacetylase (PgdA/CDA1 family)